MKREKLDTKADVHEEEEVKSSGEGCVESEAESGLPVSRQEPRQSTKLTPLAGPGRNQACTHPDFGLSASRTVGY